MKTSPNYLIHADNIHLIDHIEQIYGAKEVIDLIYLDPPFFSQKNYEVVWGDDDEIRSFTDRWEGGISHYIGWMEERVKKLKEVLSPTGSIYLHCDWHASHYLKIMMDRIFGMKNFRNEIVWCYDTSGKSRNYFNRKHDSLLFYTKSDEWTFNEQREETTKNIERYNKVDEEGNKYYMRSGKYKVTWQGTKPIHDYWTDLPALTNNAKERLGYPTQKPEALLERIIRASSNEGDLVLDPFCGCGTTIAVSQRLGRRWIGMDVSHTAITTMQKRLTDMGVTEDQYKIYGDPSSEEDLGKLQHFDFQNWVMRALGARSSRVLSADHGIDGHLGDTGIQVKQSTVGIGVVDAFVGALQKGHFKKGIIVGLDFTKGAYEGVAKVKDNVEINIEEIKLVKAVDILVEKNYKTPKLVEGVRVEDIILEEKK